MSSMDDTEREDLANRFTYHPPTSEQAARYVVIRDYGHGLAATIMNHCPASRERSLAIVKLEEAVMWANASIARNE